MSAGILIQKHMVSEILSRVHVTWRGRNVVSILPVVFMTMIWARYERGSNLIRLIWQIFKKTCQGRKMQNTGRKDQTENIMLISLYMPEKNYFTWTSCDLKMTVKGSAWLFYQKFGCSAALRQLGFYSTKRTLGRYSEADTVCLYSVFLGFDYFKANRKIHLKKKKKKKKKGLASVCMNRFRERNWGISLISFFYLILAK